MLLKERHEGLEDVNEDVSTYWTTLRKRKDTELERESTRSHAMKNSF
jgi:hypothetical protein